MLAVFVNMLAVIAGGTIGLFMKKGIRAETDKAIHTCMGLALLVMGMGSALESTNAMIMIVCAVVGVIIGEWIDIHGKMEQLSLWVEKTFAKDAKVSFAKGFLNSTLLFCVGSMSIVGSIEAGLSHEYTTIFTKSLLDFVAAIIMASTLGIGVLGSAAYIFIYQGGITVLASFIGQLLTTPMITDISAVGGLCIMALGFNFIRNEQIKVANMIPGIFLPVLVHIVLPYLSQILSFF